MGGNRFVAKAAAALALLVSAGCGEATDPLSPDARKIVIGPPPPLDWSVEVICGPERDDRSAGGAVVRGEVVECYAIPGPNSPSLQIDTWHFESAAGGVIVEASASAVEFAQDPSREHNPNPWKGRAVTSGSVQVQGTWLVAGAPAGSATGAGALAVTPRDWAAINFDFAATTPPIRYSVGSELPYPPEPDKNTDQYEDGTFGVYHFEQANLPALPVTEGPNAGYFYLAAPPALDPPEIVINHALQPGDPFRARQRGDGPGTIRLAGLRPCGPSDMKGLHEAVVRHELGHHEAMVSFVNDRATIDLLEASVAYLQVTAFKDPNATNAVQLEIGAAFRAAYAARVNESVHSDPRYAVTLRCRLS